MNTEDLQKELQKDMIRMADEMLAKIKAMTATVEKTDESLKTIAKALGII